MSGSQFQFKHFNIEQDQCAMKVGTDGVLLGAWANIDSARVICDIGTGTGLIALMSAQRNSLANIYAIELDKNAFQQSSFNVKQSPWFHRISVIHSDFKSIPLSKKPDHFICNPPFFNASHLPTDNARQNARHNTNLDLHSIFTKCEQLGQLENRISLVLPFESYEMVCEIASAMKYQITRLTKVKPTPLKKPKRLLLEFSNGFKANVDTLEDELTIEIERHKYTSQYIELTKNFYWNM